jgi:hypothetical protein
VSILVPRGLKFSVVRRRWDEGRTPDEERRGRGKEAFSYVNVRRWKVRGLKMPFEGESHWGAAS